jgi:hypothetical protein
MCGVDIIPLVELPLQPREPTSTARLFETSASPSSTAFRSFPHISTGTQSCVKSLVLQLARHGRLSSHRDI